MNNTMGNPDDADQSAAIRKLNDQFRQTMNGGTVLLTAGVVALGAEKQAEILAAVRAFDTFDADNDPWAEHDFGSIDIAGERVFFKLDYYDLTHAFHSPDPADPSVTERVMTIMLASEY
jgi:hypothetical protein